MMIIRDSEGREMSALMSMVNYRDHQLLEIGCGDGRLTCRYVENAASVVAIDPNADDIEKAKASMPYTLRARVRFLPVALDDFAATHLG
jgi:cyclopropane fatty-acyl-phospholipid synthase-like methyltransferase